jgi:hypothetical protein
VHATEEEFWAYLRGWGGAWLWEHTYLPFGIDALVDSIAEGTAILVTDGSYSRKIRHDIDGAGWLIYCKRRKKVVFKGSFSEWSGSAGSYRGELLGLLAVHLMVLAVEKFYDLAAGPRGLVACDNLGGLNKSRERRKKIPPGAKHNLPISYVVYDVLMLHSVVRCSINMSTVIKTSTRSGRR